MSISLKDLERGDKIVLRSGRVESVLKVEFEKTETFPYLVYIDVDVEDDYEAYTVSGGWASSGECHQDIVEIRKQAKVPAEESLEKITDTPDDAQKLREILDRGPANNVLKDDPVDHPSHYCDHPSGVECIEITEHMNFNCGNAVKYIWRADLKGKQIQDLEKARWYIDREINRIAAGLGG